MNGEVFDAINGLLLHRCTYHQCNAYCTDHGKDINTTLNSFLTIASHCPSGENAA